MYVNVAVLRETLAHERRVALMPSVTAGLVKVGRETTHAVGAGEAGRLPDESYKDVVFMKDRVQMVADADIVLAVQPPALEVVEAMKEGSVSICFVYAEHQQPLVKRLDGEENHLLRNGASSAHHARPSMDALSSQSALGGYYAVGLGATHLTRVLPKLHRGGGDRARPCLGHGAGSGRA